MPKVLDDISLKQVESKLPILALAVGNAIELMTKDADRFVFALFVIDNKTGAIFHSSDGQKEHLFAALVEFLSKQSH